MIWKCTISGDISFHWRCDIAVKRNGRKSYFYMCLLPIMITLLSSISPDILLMNIPNLQKTMQLKRINLKINKLFQINMTDNDPPPPPHTHTHTHTQTNKPFSQWQPSFQMKAGLLLAKKACEIIMSLSKDLAQRTWTDQSLVPGEVVDLLELL